MVQNEAVIEAEIHDLEGALRELDRVAPNAPFLALGQTVFWDEPMKAGIAVHARKREKPRQFVAGVHDTDYFAKLPSGAHQAGQFKAVAHNDTTTKGLWSAAAEFSALFGSETIVTREALARAGLRLEKITRGRPQLLDEATEAWGWRGIVSLDENPPISAEIPLKDLYGELKATLNWAIDLSLGSVCDPQREQAERQADALRAMLDNAAAGDDLTLATFYERLLPCIYSFASGEPAELSTTTTTGLLRFNKKTSSLPRFDLLNAFVSPDSAEAARACYNEAIAGTEIYGLDRFGTGAIPFDLVIPGVGRGTLRIAPNAVVVMTPQPQFISLAKPLRHVQDLADAITSKFGDNTVVIGKAVSLIGMLAREFVFVFHEGASSYVKYTRKFHGLLQRHGLDLKMNPILRVRLNIWDALAECNTWIRLPEPFQRPFGTEELTSPSFAGRWRDVADEQAELLSELGALRSPLDLIRFLERRSGGSWHCLAREYDSLHEQLQTLEVSVNDLKKQRVAKYGELRNLKQQRGIAERAMGQHFRDRIFEQSPSEEDLQERERHKAEVEAVIHRIAEVRSSIKHLLKAQSDIVSAEEIRKIHDRRREIELEAELKRLRLIRQAVITSAGLERANFRPSAWWFPLLCPDGGWFRSTMARAECYLEPLQP